MIIVRLSVGGSMFVFVTPEFLAMWFGESLLVELGYCTSGKGVGWGAARGSFRDVYKWHPFPYVAHNCSMLYLRIRVV